MKYINDTIAYRNAKRNENGQKTLQEELKNDSVITPKRKRQKQISNDSILNQIDFVRDYKDELLEGDENE